MDAFKRRKVLDWDKEIHIQGPEDLHLSVNFDDVDHDSVETLVDEMVDTLNDWWNNR